MKRYQRERIPDEIVQRIRAEYIPYKVPLKLIAHRYGLSISVVWCIVKRRRAHK